MQAKDVVGEWVSSLQCSRQLGQSNKVSRLREAVDDREYDRITCRWWEAGHKIQRNMGPWSGGRG